MILLLEQIERLPQKKHLVKTPDNRVLYYGRVNEIFEADISVGEDYYEIITESISRTSIKKNRAEIGCISQKLVITKKILFLKTGYEYFEIEINNIRCYMYEPGLEPDQHYFSIYCQDDTIAVIHKCDKVVNYLNNSILYAKDKQSMMTALLCAMFLESTAFCHRGVKLGNTVSNIPYYSSQIELQEKYDPAFIPGIKAMDGITD